jgi:hypothetical protein
MTGKPIPFASWERVSTEDRQDPESSRAWQYARGKAQRGTDDRMQRGRVGQGRVQVFPAEQGLAEGERGEAADQHGEEDSARAHREFGPQHRQPCGHDSQRGADHSGAVLTGDQQDSQDSDGQLRENRPGQTGGNRGGTGIDVIGLAGGDGRKQGAETDHEHDGGQQRVHRRPERAELGPLRQHDPCLRHPQPTLTAERWRRRSGRERGGHAATAPVSAVRYSTESLVNVMNACSSEAC